MYLLWILLGFYYVQFISSQVYNVRDFNATGDGKTDDTNAIRAALAAAANSNGGRVIFDCGLTFLTGAINVTSNVILDLCGTILASNISDIFHYPLIPPLPWYGGGTDFQESGAPDRQSVIQSYNATNITLTGGGIVDGQGYPWWACSWNASGLEKPPCNNISRPNFVRFIYSSKIIVHDITLKDCTAWCLHLAWVTTSHVYNVNIITPDLHIAHNTDGVDIDCSVDILVENVFYKGSDDAVAVKSGKDYNGRTFGRTTENVIVRNFTIFNSSNSGMSIGSEMSGGIRNVTFTDIYANGTDCGPRIKTARGRGGVVEDIIFNNFQVYHTKNIAEFALFHSTDIPTNDTGTPKLKNIKITNSYFDGVSGGWHFSGLPESPYRAVYLTNIIVKNYGSKIWASCADIDGFCDNSSVTPSCPPCLNAGCPTNWYQSTVDKSQCYRLYNSTLAASDAQFACQNSTLTSLISIDSAFENNDITSYIGKTYPSCQNVYIGLQQNGSNWSWINGDNSTYRYWDSNYPISTPNANCVVINQNGKWRNQDCTNTQCYICGFSLYNS